MAISTYAEVQAAVLNWLNRTGDTDTTARVPEFIQLAEASFKRRPEFQDEVYDTITLDQSPVTLPATAREIQSLYFDDTIRQGPIDLVSPEQLADYLGVYGSTASWPRKAAITSDGTQLLLGPPPDQSYTGRIVYQLALTPLATSVNWLLTSHPDIYLFGTLLEAAPYVKDEMPTQLWEARLEKAIGEMRDQIERRRWGNTLVARPRRAIGENVYRPQTRRL